MKWILIHPPPLATAYQADARLHVVPTTTPGARSAPAKKIHQMRPKIFKTLYIYTFREAVCPDLQGSLYRDKGKAKGKREWAAEGSDFVY